jgi:hypothetical protein
MRRVAGAIWNARGAIGLFVDANNAGVASFYRNLASSPWKTILFL